MGAEGLFLIRFNGAQLGQVSGAAKGLRMTAEENSVAMNSQQKAGVR